MIKGLTDALFLQPKGWFKFLKRPRPTQPIPPAKWNATLKRLQDLRLLEHDPDTGRLDAHPLLREYFAATLSKNQPEAWQEGHRRLYQQLKDSVPHHPEGLTGLQALYQAVVHGCRAGLYQEALNEVYISRILRGTGSDGFYSAKKLGAFGADLGAVACFFTEPWQRLAPGLPVGDQAWLLNEAATRLRALGRLAEALEPMWVGAESAEAQADWKNAAIYYGNLSLLQLSLGRIVLAVADAERAVDYADRSGDAFQRISKRTALADARHQQGEWEAARRGFAEAEAMQAERKLEYLQLYSRPGFRYGELLLTEAERAAWGGPAAAEGSEGCAQVAQRAAQALPIAMRNNHLLSIALAQLTLARSALYTDLLHGRTPGEDAQQHTEAAVAGLHRIAQLVRALGAQHLRELVVGVRRGASGQLRCDDLPVAQHRDPVEDLHDPRQGAIGACGVTHHPYLVADDDPLASQVAGLGGAHHLTAHHHLAAEAPAVDGDHLRPVGR